MRIILLLFAVVLLLGLVVVFSDEKNATSLLDPTGSLSTGRKFGVQVGDSEEKAAIELKQRGFSDLVIDQTSMCMGQNLPAQKILFAYDPTWRNGIVCVGFRDEKVNIISWEYNFLNP